MSSASPRSLGQVRATLGAAYRGYGVRLVALAAVAAFGAVMEAASLGTLVPLVASVASADHVFHLRHRLLPAPIDLTVPQLLAICVATVVMRAVAQAAAVYRGSQLSSAYGFERRSRLLSSYLSADWSVQSREKAGHLQNLLSENVTFGISTLNALTQCIVAVANFAILLGVAFFIDFKSALAIIVVACVLFLMTRPLSTLAHRHAHAKSDLNVHYASRVSELVAMSRELRVFRAVESVKAFAAKLDVEIRKSRGATMRAAGLVPVIYQNAAGLLIIGGLATVYYAGVSDVAALSTVALMLIRTLSYSQTFQSIFNNIVASLPYLTQLQVAEHSYTVAAVDEHGEKLEHVDQLAFRKVRFHYEGGPEVVHDLDFEVRRGEVIGIIGPSGSGKSTLIQLLLRLRRPSAGVVEVNGKPNDVFSQTSWFSRVSYVPQEPQLLSASVAENIRFFRPEISDARVAEAARLAGVDADVAKMVDAYETDVGERGGDAVSGGQRQRICIARALAGDPEVIVFDEPTSALDAHSEAVVRDTISHLRGNKMVFMIAHRLSTLNACNRVMVLRDGCIQSFAPAIELASSDAYYSEALRLSQVTP